MYDFDTPEGRLAALEQLGIAGYRKELEAHLTRCTFSVVNGHKLRAVSTRFGRLYAVGDTGRAFASTWEAEAFAMANGTKPEGGQ